LVATGLYGRYEVRVLNTNTGRADAQVAGVTARKATQGLGFVARFAALMLSYRPDVVHINSSGFLPLLLIEALQLRIGRTAGVYSVLHIRGSMHDTYDRTHPRARHLQGRVFRSADRVLTLHAAGIDVLKRYGVVGHQISNFVMERPAPDRSGRSGPVRILFVGWILPAKGVIELIEAMAEVAGAHLTLLGRVVNDSGDEVAAALEKAGIQDRVEMPGEVPMSEVWAHYDRADIFALPSWTEGFPNTLVEAMMCGLPAVYTDVGAMPEMQIDGETGIQVGVREVAALRTALQTLVADEALRLQMGQAARARALEHFEMSAVLHRLADHYDDLLGVQTRPGHS